MNTDQQHNLGNTKQNAPSTTSLSDQPTAAATSATDREVAKPTPAEPRGNTAGPAYDFRGRQRRYVISMSVCIASIILSTALWNVSRPLGWIALIVALALPYPSVVIANGGRKRAQNRPVTVIHPPVPPMSGRGEEEKGRRHRTRPAAGHVA
ncbi:DUF3099 domain-containing protein [Streptomyces sp. TRM68367]|uniref:DUF3099 domain-containing protein n=1 Tax=Streptomyces sp. TRM68367 TaxID=2758415 RepID=UPI00165B9278|nr:DUF3099 domain-containing protein [Streptomyces sp. TRM68367]MBC9727583.1 DUF3099 domain-containing protein [Streptomyces sp. TRM68367]